MDYEPMAEFHWEHEADITVAVQPIAESDCSRFGLLKRDPDSKISSFVEKPSDPAVLSKFVCRDDPKRPYLGSMGIYLFKTSVLEELLENTTHTDFGGQIIPKALSTHAVFGYDFEGYWEDIGTIRSFYETNLRLAHPDSPFNFYDPDLPIYTHPRFLPGSVIDGAAMINVLLADGCQIHQAEINNSVIGLRSQVADGVSMCDTVLMGADYYDTPETIIDSIPIGVGPNSEIEGAIIDKNVRIGEGVKIKPFPRGTEIDTEKWSVRDGIVVVPKSTILHPRSHIGPE
jgi:glucose-1-phosphate adenylyltransferase